MATIFAITAGYRSLLVLIVAGVLTGCGVAVRGIHDATVTYQNSEAFHTGRHGPLTEKELRWAKIAWKYFENNYNPGTGLVNSVDNYPSTTLWHMGNTVAATVAAYELGLLERERFDARFSKLLQFLNRMALFDKKLPNKAYNSKTGKMVNYENAPGAIGWSAVDIGRLVNWLLIARSRYPEFSQFIDNVMLRWSFCDVVDDCGSLYGGVEIVEKIDAKQSKTEDGQAQTVRSIKRFEEGRLGYEEYAAFAYQLLGFDTARASSLKPFKTVSIYGYELPHDDRDPRTTGTWAPILSGPYLLHGMEFNWDLPTDNSSSDTTHTDSVLAEIAQTVYDVQQARYDRERILTARTDHQLNRAPNFLFDSIFAAGFPWSTISDDGKSQSHLALISTKAVFGMWVLFKTPYTDRLMLTTEAIHNADRGWLEGRYEKSGGWEGVITSDTNSQVLEALLYKVQGKLWRPPVEPSMGQILVQDQFTHPGKCLPPRRKARACK